MNFGDFFLPQKSLKMRDVLEKMRECGKLPNLRDFPHDCGMVDTYVIKYAKLQLIISGDLLFAATDYCQDDLLRHAAQDLRRKTTAQRDPARYHREPDEAAIGTTPEGTVSRRRGCNLDHRRPHCLPCWQREKGISNKRARLGQRA